MYNLVLSSFFFLLSFAKFLHSFLFQLCKYLQEPAGPYHQALFGKYLHLQYNVFVIYDEAKAVPQRPSHNKLPQKQAANRQGNTSHRTMIPTKLLLCIFVEITLRHECPYPLLSLVLFFINNPLLTLSPKIVQTFLKNHPKKLFSNCLVDGLLTSIV